MFQEYTQKRKFVLCLETYQSSEMKNIVVHHTYNKVEFKFKGEQYLSSKISKQKNRNKTSIFFPLFSLAHVTIFKVIKGEISYE